MSSRRFSLLTLGQPHQYSCSAALVLCATTLVIHQLRAEPISLRTAGHLFDGFKLRPKLQPIGAQHVFYGWYCGYTRGYRVLADF